MTRARNIAGRGRSRLLMAWLFQRKPAIFIFAAHAFAAALVCLALMDLGGARVQAQDDSASEYDVKAAMLYNLTQFVTWPLSARSDPQAPTVICVLGRDPFGPSLSTFLRSEQGAARMLEVHFVENPKEIRSCSVLYVSSSEKKKLDLILSGLRGSSVLTVGEMAQFAAHGGMIQFSLMDQHVGFTINLDAVSQADLKVSSKLLALARIVHGAASPVARQE